VIKAFEAVSYPADFLDDQVDGFGAAVADAVGVEVGQHLGPPGAEGAPEPGDLRNRADVEAVQYIDRDLASLRWYGVLDRAKLLIALPGHVHLLGGVAGAKACADLGLLARGEVFDAAAE
jgi:hypothetical protein